MFLCLGAKGEPEQQGMRGALLLSAPHPIEKDLCTQNLTPLTLFTPSIL